MLFVAADAKDMQAAAAISDSQLCVINDELRPCPAGYVKKEERKGITVSKTAVKEEGKKDTASNTVITSASVKEAGQIAGNSLQKDAVTFAKYPGVLPATKHARRHNCRNGYALRLTAAHHC